MRTLLLLVLRTYQLCVSPYLGQNCRFHPCCSNYAAEAIRGHGAMRGLMLTAQRLCKCHPWHAGGVDPVPTVRKSVAEPLSQLPSAPARGCGHP